MTASSTSPQLARTVIERGGIECFRTRRLFASQGAHEAYLKVSRGEPKAPHAAIMARARLAADKRGVIYQVKAQRA